MSTYTELQDSVLDYVKQGQDTIVEAIDTWVPSLPISGQLPKAADVVDDSFAFAEKLLHSQREFVGRIFAALANEPAKPKTVKATTKSAA